MRSTGRKTCVLGFVLMLSGCLSPWTTRFPTAQPRHPLVEKKSYEFHDPFPERAAAPDTENRPRGFENARAAPRRAVEGAMLRGMPQHPEPLPAQPLPSSQKYPNAVQY